MTQSPNHPTHLDVPLLHLLHTEKMAWLTTVRADGMPLPTPVWFLWNDGQFLLFSEPEAVKVRNIRRKAKDDLDALKGEISDDEIARGDKELDVITKKHVDQIDDALKKKEAELLEV